jgi:hypothetical protein
VTVKTCVARTVKVVDGPATGAVALEEIPAAELTGTGPETPVERFIGIEVLLTLTPSAAPTEVELIPTAVVLVTAMTDDEFRNFAVASEVESDGSAISAITC